MAKTLKEKQEQFLPRFISPAADKEKILKYINEGELVLDISYGNTQLIQLLMDKFDKVKVTALDSSQEGMNNILSKIEYYPDRITLADVRFTSYLTTQKFDVIVFCSSMHQIFSDTEINGRKFDLNVIGKIMKKACEMLKPGGRIIIRDSIASSNNHKVTVQFKDKNLEKLAKIYIKDFAGFPMEVRETEVGFVMNYNSMVEMLYAISWGDTSLVKESKKFRTFFSLKDWEELAYYTEKYYGVKLFESFEYLQRGYEDALEGKVKLYSSIPENPSRRLIQLPPSTAVVVFKKESK